MPETETIIERKLLDTLLENSNFVSALMSDDGGYRDEIQIREKDGSIVIYKVFKKIPDTLFTEKDSELLYKRPLPESYFEDKDLVWKLLREGIIEHDTSHTKLICFNYSIKHEEELKKRLTKTNIDEIEPVLNVWRTYNKGYDAAFIMCDINFQVKISRVDFQYWCFIGKADFSKAVFGEVNFGKATFFSKTFFNGSTFDTVDFSSATFKNEADFGEKTEFNGKAKFTKAKFESVVNLAKITFKGEADFENAVFQEAKFTEAKFKKETIFDKSIFNDEVDFNKAIFDDIYKDVDDNDKEESQSQFSVKFNNVEFKKKVYFEETKFDGKIDFRKTTFRKGLIWKAVLKRGVHFSEARFYEADFQGAEFKNVLFNKAHFFKNTSFEDVLFNVKANFSEAKFEEGGEVDFTGLKSCEIYFDKTIFNNVVIFREAKFTEKASFEEAKFRKGLRFYKAAFKALSFLRAEFKWADFYMVKFKGEADFSKTTFENDANFTKAKFIEKANFSKATFKEKLLLHETIFKETCYFDVNEFGTYVDFRRAEFREGVVIKEEKLISNEDVKRLKVIGEGEHENITETKENIHTVKKIFGKVESYENEDLLYYWYKVYERKCAVEEDKKNLAEAKGRKKHLFKMRNFCEKIVLEKFIDKHTSYFTNPVKTLKFIGLTIVVFWASYFIVSISGMGGIQKGEGKMLWEGLTFCFKSFDNILLFLEHLFKTLYLTLYFSIITFTTIGYGDYHPVGLAMLFACAEGFSGVFLMPVFLVTLAKKILW